MGERKVMMGRDFWGAGSSTQVGEGELGSEGKDEHEEYGKDENEVFILINFSFLF